MKKPFYSRLAFTNLQKNRTIYLPYLLSGGLIVALYYILRSISIMVMESNMEGAGHMYEMLSISAGICGVLSLVVLFYINSFVMKRRKKEFGLYSILGLGKRHISLVILWEVGITALVSIAGGIIGGALLSQLLFLILLRMVRLPVALTFRIPLDSVLSTGLLFAAGYVVVLLFDIASVWRTNPAALLRSANQGEREPKARWLLTLLGLVTLGGGYVVAWSSQSPYDAMALFQIAVLLVIAGTFLLFIAGSVVLLKLLRKRKNFYYKPENFIAVSGMLYRMKQNAAGLANICILSTCVLVTLSSTVCLFIGEEDLLRYQFPRQVRTESSALDVGIVSHLEAAIDQHAAEHGFTVENTLNYFAVGFAAQRTGDKFPPIGTHTTSGYNVKCLSYRDYHQITGSGAPLKPGTALIYNSGAPLESGSITFDETTYQVAGEIPEPTFLRLGGSQDLVAILPELDDLKALSTGLETAGYHISPSKYYCEYDVSGDAANHQAFYSTVREALSSTVPQLRYIDTIESARADFYQIYGSLLFIGVFFVALFLVATVLIIYYKQITEGFDDHDRFQIMEKIGMGEKEVRSTIHKQVLLVFFLPLGVSVLHITVAFRVLCQLLLIFNMTNTALFALCVLGTVLLFSALYFAVYRLTARSYFRIVQARA